MPAVSKKQQSFFALVRAAQEGKIDKDKLSESVKHVAKNISKEDAHHFAATKRKGLPEKKASPLDYMFVNGFLSRLSEMNRR